jgi:hypothetical protein
MAGVYSTRFLISGGSPVGVSYTVPAGKKAVVKCVTCLNGSSTATQVYLYIADSAIWSVNVPGLVGALASGIMLVANSGEKIAAAAGHSNCGFSIHGYLLDTL